ncbi:I78 family peptidase inhibitor [Rhodobacteraceae bacterium]|nr:I78 family peptidase inhibitor [Paracoccaceae bacterium]
MISLLKHAVPFVGVLVVAACGANESAVIEEVTSTGVLPSGAERGVVSDTTTPGTEFCDASDYRSLVGTNVEATVFPEGSNFRVFSLDDIVTRDFIPQRTNVVYTSNGEISEVYCG